MDDISTVQNELEVKTEYESDVQSEIESSESDTGALYLTFVIGKELLGIPVSSVREVIEYKKVFKTPRVPDYIRGVINLRGEVVPVIDLSARFYNIKSSVIGTSAIVIVEVEENRHKTAVGVIIDAVRAVVEISGEKIDATPDIGSRIRPDFITGIGKVEKDFVILLKTDSILNIEELSDFN